MKTFVLISAIIELLAGSVFLFAPQVIPDFSAGGAGILAMARMYGAAALALGIFALHVWKNIDMTGMRKAFLQTFLLFHVGVAIAIYSCHGAGVMSDLGGTILHTTLAVLTGYFYFKNNT